MNYVAEFYKTNAEERKETANNIFANVEKKEEIVEPSNLLEKIKDDSEKASIGTADLTAFMRSIGLQMNFGKTTDKENADLEKEVTIKEFIVKKYEVEQEYSGEDAYLIARSNIYDLIIDVIQMNRKSIFGIFLIIIALSLTLGAVNAEKITVTDVADHGTKRHNQFCQYA